MLSLFINVRVNCVFRCILYDGICLLTIVSCTRMYVYCNKYLRYLHIFSSCSCYLHNPLIKVRVITVILPLCDNRKEHFYQTSQERSLGSILLLLNIWGRNINDRIASIATLKLLIASVAANAVSLKCDRYFRV